MDKEKIKQATQLSDDLKKINRALGLFDDENGKMAVRMSKTVDGEETIFAYLPQCVIPALYTLLAEAKSYITQKMEEL